MVQGVQSTIVSGPFLTHETLGPMVTSLLKAILLLSSHRTQTPHFLQDYSKFLSTVQSASMM